MNQVAFKSLWLPPWMSSLEASLGGASLYHLPTIWTKVRLVLSLIFETLSYESSNLFALISNLTKHMVRKIGIIFQSQEERLLFVYTMNYIRVLWTYVTLSVTLYYDRYVNNEQGQKPTEDMI